MTCSGCFLRLKPDSWCAECVEVARENQLRAMRLIEVVEADPSIFSAETRASVEMMRWIVRHYQAREQRDERAKRLLAEIDDLRNGVEAGKRAALEQARASESAALRARVDELEERIERLRQWAEGIPTYDEAGMAARTALEIMEGK